MLIKYSQDNLTSGLFCRTLELIKKMSRLVITLVVLSIANLKWIDARRTSKPIISIIIDNNSDNNYSTELISAPILKWGRRKVFTSTAAFRLPDLCRE